MSTPDPKLIQLPPHKSGLLARLRSNFLAGLVVVAPIGITVWLVWTLTGWMDSWVLPMIPARWRPEHYIGINLRGLGAIVFLLFTVVIGWAAKGWLGRAFLRTGERIVARTPFVRSVYGGVKQIAETIHAQSEARCDRTWLIEYPRKGLWGVGRVAGRAKGEIQERRPQNIYAVFVPTTPNPTSGYLIYAPEEDLIFLDLTVEDAAKLVISAGLVYPPDRELGEDDE